MSEKTQKIATPAFRHPLAPQPHAESPDANGPGQSQADAQTTDVTSAIHHAHADKAAATHQIVDDARQDAIGQQDIAQVRAQLATIRGLPQYADLERDLQQKLDALEGKTPPAVT